MVKANTYREPSPGLQREVIDSVDFRSVVDKVNAKFRLPKDAWQPSDLMPPLSVLVDSPDELKQRRKLADNLSDGLLICLMGNAVTEETLGNYTRDIERNFPQTERNSGHPLHRFARWWAAEEQKHGTVLERYLGLIKRVNLRRFEETVSTLNAEGFDIRSGDSAYQGLIYPRIQEDLTAMAHLNVGTLSGEPNLLKICGKVCADEVRHKTAYHDFVAELFRQDSIGVTTSFGNLVRKGIVMPSEGMGSAEEPDLYTQFSEVAAEERVLSARDLLKAHRNLTGEGAYGLRLASANYSGENAADAEKARKFLLETYPKMLERASNISVKKKEREFSWLKKSA
ncbi:MAG: acyl-ACP desaturase [Candidatus Pacearchaeota archaeon]